MQVGMWRLAAPFRATLAFPSATLKVSQRSLFGDNPLGKLAEQVDTVKKTHLREDMSKGTGVITATEIYKNPAIKVVQPQAILPPAPFPVLRSWGPFLTISGQKARLEHLLQDGLGYKLLMVIEKRQIGFFMTNQWRNAMASRFPTVPVLEVILVHQFSQMLFLPVLWAAFWSRLEKNAAPTTFVHVGPCREFMREIRLQNPYVPNVYLIDKDGRACWVSSSAPTQEDMSQLEKILRRGQKASLFHNKKQQTKDDDASTDTTKE